MNDEYYLRAAYMNSIDSQRSTLGEQSSNLDAALLVS